MKSPWKIATLVLCIAVIGTVIIAWQVRKHKQIERKLAETAQTYRVRAEQGDAAAQASLAYMYSHGEGVQRNYDQAAIWYRKSADQGNPRGENGLGYMYYTGEGVDQDLTEAVRWYRRAADQGYATAQDNLGNMYYYGFSLPVDYAEAARWYRKAADRGNASAQYDLACVYLYGKGMPQDRAIANWWFHKAAANGDEAAQRFLGLRGSGLSTIQIIIVATLALACVLLFSAYLRPIDPEARARNRGALASALLLLVLLALQLFDSFHGVPRDPLYIPILFHSTVGAVSGMSIATILMSMSWVRGARRMLVISAVCFVICNLIVLGICLHAVGHLVNFRTLAATPPFYAIEAGPIGMAIPAAILLGLSGRPGQGSNASDSGFEESEPPADNEMGI